MGVTVTGYRRADWIADVTVSEIASLTDLQELIDMVTKRGPRS
ncbi:MAG: hypothetical protein ACHQWU_12775 [Gemmatimonadales bacterium]